MDSDLTYFTGPGMLSIEYSRPVLNLTAEPTRTSSQAEETQEDKTIAPQPHPSGSEGSPQRLNGGCSRDARAISPSDGFRTTPPFNHP